MRTTAKTMIDRKRVKLLAGFIMTCFESEMIRISIALKYNSKLCRGICEVQAITMDNLKTDSGQIVDSLDNQYVQLIPSKPFLRLEVIFKISICLQPQAMTQTLTCFVDTIRRNT